MSSTTQRSARHPPTVELSGWRSIVNKRRRLYGLVATSLCISFGSLFGGVYHDLGRPVVGAWRSFAKVVFDPVLKRDLLWSQECSQDGAILFATELASGEVVEEHEIPAREVGGMLVTAAGVIYLYTYSGLNHPGNELLRFHPKRREIERLGFPEIPRNRPATGVVGKDGHIYIGTHQEGRLFRFRNDNSTWEDLGQKVPPPLHKNQNVWLRPGTVLPDGRLLASVVRTPPAQIIVIDPTTGDFRQVEQLSSAHLVVVDCKVLKPLPRGVAYVNDELVVTETVDFGAFRGAERYTTTSSFTLLAAPALSRLLCQISGAEGAPDVVRVDLAAKTLTHLARLPFEGSTLTTTNDQVVVVDLARQRFATVDLENGTFELLKFQYRGKRGSQICGLTKSSDGSIYGTNIIGMHIFRHDPIGGVTQDLGPVGWPGGEVYNTIDAAGKIYFGTYGGGYWGVYDPARPWEPDLDTLGTSPRANPHKIGQLGGETPAAANRPFEYVVGPQGRIFVACRANYGHPGGALVEFDPATGKTQLFRDLKRSVQTVTASSSHVFGGTSIRGGRGSGVHAKVATVFVHDPQQGTRTAEQALIPEAKAITCLRYDAPTRQLYGTSDNQLFFVIDPNTLGVTGRWPLRSAGTPLAGVPEDVGMTFIAPAHDGNVYGVTYSDLFRWNATSRTIEYLDTPPMPGLYQIVEGSPGEFYMGAGTHLLKYFVKAPAYYR
jgi:outer membrane protein assembly factor BamB